MVTDAPQGIEPDPGRVVTVADLALELGRLKIWQGDLPLRTLSKQCGIPSSTIHDALRGHRLPKLDTVLRLARALNGDGPEWHAAWSRGANSRRNRTEPGGIDLTNKPAPSRPLTPSWASEIDSSASAYSIEIPVEKILNSDDIARVQAETHTSFAIQQDGLTYLGALHDGDPYAALMRVGTLLGSDSALAVVVNPAPRIGDKFNGIVVKVAAFGAFITMPPIARDALLHISKLGDGRTRVEHVEEYLLVGDSIAVEVEAVRESNSGRDLIYLSAVNQKDVLSPRYSYRPEPSEW